MTMPPTKSLPVLQQFTMEGSDKLADILYPYTSDGLFVK
ncbi:hypothetical protein O23A_p1073 [Aeromonas salmonicida]|nr:hypothetical protein O23A_p1073 [Aeromonas salmonicida]